MWTRTCSCAAVWVSNHGGRQLDAALATIDALPDVVAAAKGTGMEVYVDGGIRTGGDAFKVVLGSLGECPHQLRP